MFLHEVLDAARENGKDKDPLFVTLAEIIDGHELKRKS
jgi:hypothetical protein